MTVSCHPGHVIDIFYTFLQEESSLVCTHQLKDVILVDRVYLVYLVGVLVIFFLDVVIIYTKGVVEGRKDLFCFMV